MPKYDPFERGTYPVGTRSHEWHDASRDRTLPVEVWYPATEAHRGQDLDASTQDSYSVMPAAPPASQQAVRDAEARNERAPLVIFSHGFGGERRQTTHLCTHLASHGYVVASMNHVGNTTLDMLQLAGAPPDPSIIDVFIADRPVDASFVIDRMVAGDAGLEIDSDHIGITGHSFGGWTTLMTTARDARIRAALPLAPAGGDLPVTTPDYDNPFRNALDFDWKRPVPTLFLVAEFDTILPLDGMRDLLTRTREPRQGLVLLNSDHFHFCDRVEQTHDLFKQMGGMLFAGASDRTATRGVPDLELPIAQMKSSAELCPGEHAYALTCGIGLAHMDAHLRDHPEASELLASDLVKVMAARGVAVEAL